MSRTGAPLDAAEALHGAIPCRDNDHDNTARKHQTTGQRAAEVALTLATAGQRENGRWNRGKVGLATSESGSTDLLKRIAECGLILDYLGRDALIAIAPPGATGYGATALDPA